MVLVRTQDGYVEKFDENKVINAITKDTEFLAQSSNKQVILDCESIKKIAAKVRRQVDKLELSNDEVLSSDTIRGLVVTELYKAGEKRLANVSEVVGPRLTDVLAVWSTNGDLAHDNANLDASNQETMHKRLADIVSEKALFKLLPDGIVRSHIDGELHIHDREYFFTRQFCFDSDLRYILYYGLIPDGAGRSLPTARAARSAEVAFLHAAKALGSAQCNCAGGQGYNSFNVLIAPYLAGKSYDEIKQLAQMFVYEMGQMTAARGAQAVFSSVQLYPGVPAIWRNAPVVAQGKIWNNKTYGDYERECRLLFKAFMEIFYEGDSRGRPFSFPKPEVVIAREFLDGENFAKHYDASGTIPTYKDLYELAFKLALKNGAPYFESQYHIENPLKSVSCMQCCSYSFSDGEDSDPDFSKKLNFVDGAHFDSLGSMQVVSLNLPRAAYMARDWEALEPRSLEDNLSKSIVYLKVLIDRCVEIFKIKRDAIAKQASPFMRQTPIDPNDLTKRAPPYCDLNALSYVIGIVGLNEYCQILIGYQLHESEDAVQLGERLLAALNLYCGKVSHDSGMKIALARTPAETTAQRFAVSDLLRDLKQGETWQVRNYVRGDVKVALEGLQRGIKDLPVEYSNGTHCAVDAPISLSKKVAIEGRFFDILAGGNIFHIFLSDISPFYTLDSVPNEEGERVPIDTTEQFERDAESLMEFGLDLAKNTPITYFTFSKDMTICLDCNAASSGIHEECPRCHSPRVDSIARITGYYAAVSGFNAAKKEELKMRKRYESSQIGG